MTLASSGAQCCGCPILLVPSLVGAPMHELGRVDEVVSPARLNVRLSPSLRPERATWSAKCQQPTRLLCGLSARS